MNLIFMGVIVFLLIAGAGRAAFGFSWPLAFIFSAALMLTALTVHLALALRDFTIT